MTVITLIAETFDETVFNHDTIVVDFWANWCGPCLAFAPIFEKVSEHHTDVIFAKVDIENSPELAKDFQIRSIPHLIIFRREFAVLSQSGVLAATQLQDLVMQAKAIPIQTLRDKVPK